MRSRQRPRCIATGTVSGSVVAGRLMAMSVLM
jgi:hypothetical protein